MFRLHSAQGSLLKYQHHYPDATNHYRSVAIDLNGDLKVSSLQQAFSKVIQRHDVLRSAINLNQDGPVFVISAEEPTPEPILVLDATHLARKPISQINETLAALHAESFFNSTFSLEKGPLWRATLIKTDTNNYQFVILIDPLIADDRSINIILNEIASYYNQLIDHTNLELPLAKISEEHRDHLDDTARQGYWRTELEDLNIIKLHTPKSYTGDVKFRGKHKPFTLHSELVAALKSQMPGYSLEQILLTSIYTLLHRYTGETDITLGTTDANRPLSNRQINSYANWLTIRKKFDRDTVFSDLLLRTANTLQSAQSMQLPIDEIYESILSDHTRRALRTIAPFDVLLTVNNKSPSFHLKDMTTSAPTQIDLGYNALSYFHLTVNQLDDGACDGFINFNTNLFDDETIERLLGHLQKILGAVALNPECNINEIPLLLESEMHALTQFNDTANQSHYGNMMTPDAFHAIASQNPNQPALVFHPLDKEPQRMSYQALDIYTNQIANYLRENLSLKKGDRIALSITRSMNLVALTLGAMKAGLVVVPIETAHGTLFEHKFETAGAVLVITDAYTNKLFDDKKISSLNIDDESVLKRIKSFDDSFYSSGLSANSPAYIMYSSGTTTGIPKASLLTHGGLVNLLNALHTQNYPQDLKVLCTALPTFDAFLFDFLAAWSSNGTVHLATDEERYSPEAVERIIRNERINFAVFLPDLMSLLPADLPLDYTISMGAASREGTFERWLAARPHRKIINGLGHTETGICLSLQEYLPGADSDLVGTPISNMQMFILDPHYHTLCPPGIPGEIFVGGPGLASEYVGNPELTRSKFLTMKYEPSLNKFTPCHAKDRDAVKLYASGDYGCYQKTNSGNLSIKCIGRTDRRIKLYGVSLDLDGIEALINKCPQVQAVTIIPNTDMTALIAYVVRKEEYRKNPAKEARDTLREHLKNTPLPPVAYPQFVLMKELPKTANGKIDLKKLPPPPDRTLLKPRHNQQLIPLLSGMWKDVLGSYDTDDIDTNTSFEELSGNSIALAALEIKINKELQLTQRVGVGQNFLSKHMTINSLADSLKPLLVNKQSTPSSPPSNRSQTSTYRGNRPVLFPDRAQASRVNYNGTSENDKNNFNSDLKRKH